MAKILVVDDQRSNVEMMAGVLQARGYDVLTAADGEAALEQVRSASPDIVVADILMPGMDGYEVARRLRDMDGGEKVTIVALTAVMHRAAGFTAGFDCYIPKPATAEDFLRVLS